MSELRIEHGTSLSRDAIRSRLSELMVEVGKSFDLQGRWDGDNYRFTRPGLDGAAGIADGKVTLTMELGFPLSALKGKIESELRSRLREKLP